jgi:Ni/Co efflux regulator RcnB
MTRLLTTAALFTAFLAMPALAQTAAPKMHHRAHHHHHHASTQGSGSSMAGRHHHFLTGDHSADRLNREELQNLAKGS